LHQGQFEWLSDRPFEARRWWRQGLAAAERLQLPYPQALLHLELARRLPSTDPARADHQTQASQILLALLPDKADNIALQINFRRD
jgi:hypothetical protein